MVKKTKVLVTGASGFIGTHLVKALSDQEVLTIKHDLLFSPDLERQIYQFAPDVIYNLAAYGQMASQKDPAAIVKANILGTFNLLEVTKSIPYKKFVQISTSSVILAHQTIYSATKLGAEALCQAYFNEYDKPTIVARPFSIYGEGEADFRFIPTVIKALLYEEKIELDTEATHDWVYIHDLINTLIKLNVPGDYNLGTGKSHSNIEIVRLLETLSGKKLKYTEKKLRSFDTNAWVSPDHSVVSNLKLGLSKTLYHYVKKYTAN